MELVEITLICELVCSPDSLQTLDELSAASRVNLVSEFAV